jgi:tRNA A37 threonylcarbamoyladenosine modification protein TsaB
LTGTWLGIDTTSILGGVALVGDGELLMETILPVRAFHSEKLLPAVAEIME